MSTLGLFCLTVVGALTRRLVELEYHLEATGPVIQQSHVLSFSTTHVQGNVSGSMLITHACILYIA